jgi:hypothetical protein
MQNLHNSNVTGGLKKNPAGNELPAGPMKKTPKDAVEIAA